MGTGQHLVGLDNGDDIVLPHGVSRLEQLNWLAEIEAAAHLLRPLDEHRGRDRVPERLQRHRGGQEPRTGGQGERAQESWLQSA